MFRKNDKVQTRLFQDKIRITVGSIVLENPATVTINSKIPVSYRLTEEPAFHQTFIEPGKFKILMEPQNFQTIEEPEFYQELMTRPMGKLEDWKDLALLTEGRTMQIWGPPKYKMSLPLSYCSYDSIT